MKTIIHNQQPLCEKQHLSYYSWPRPSFGLLSFLPAQKKKSSRFSGLKIHHLHQFVSALRAMFVGLNALVCSVSVNTRLFSGLVIAGVMAPGASCLHLLFDSKGNLDFTWYHVNNYYLFNALGPYLSMAFLVAGLFLILPKNYKAQYWLSPFMGYPIVKVITMYVCETNEQWNAGLFYYGWLPMALAVVTIGLVIMLGIDHFTWRKYHSFDGNMARIIGLVSISEMKPDEKERLIQEIKKAQSFSF
jgi:hypothetical protein